MVILAFAGVTQMGANAALLTGHEVILCPILVIAYYGLGSAPRVALVLLNEIKQLAVFRYASRRTLHRCHHSFGVIDGAMMVITRTRVVTPATDHRRVRIGRAHHPLVDRLVTLRRCHPFTEFTLRRLIRPL